MSDKSQGAQPQAPGQPQAGQEAAGGPGYSGAPAGSPGAYAYAGGGQPNVANQQAAGPMYAGAADGAAQATTPYGGGAMGSGAGYPPAYHGAYYGAYDPNAQQAMQPPMQWTAPMPYGQPAYSHGMAGAVPYAPYVVYGAVQPGPYQPMQGAPAGMGAAPYAAPPVGAHHSGAAGAGRQAGMSELIDELANGGNGLASVGRLLNLEDSEFWKGALVGAAAVLLLTNESVQDVLFKTGAKAKEAVQSGADKLKQTAAGATDKTKS